MPKSPAPYPQEFRDEAVQLLHSSEKPLRQLARELGISDETLRKWKRQAAIDRGDLAGLTTSEREELQQLRQENKVLRQERDIFQQAAAC